MHTGLVISIYTFPKLSGKISCMKFLATICLTFLMLLGSTGYSLATYVDLVFPNKSLPKCKGSPSSSWSTSVRWTDCFGVWFITSGIDKGYKYVGEFKDGTYHGQGTLTFSAPHKLAGFKYVGEWKNGKQHGQGTDTFSAPHKLAGIKYVGEFKDGKQHGQGTLTFPDGRVKEGIWKKGKFQYWKKAK